MYEDNKYKLLSAWSYFGYELLFQIPVVGIVFLIVFSFSNKNLNRRNFARAHFCGLAVCLVIIAVVAVLGFAFGFTDKFLGNFSDAIKNIKIF